jgi:hypothetical protein
MENSKAKINFFHEILHDLEDRLGGKRKLSIPYVEKNFYYAGREAGLWPLRAACAWRFLRLRILYLP